MCLDPAALERIRQVGGEPLARRMVELFRENVPRWIDDARRGLEHGDLATVERACHSLRSSAGNLGAERLMTIATDIELRAEAGDASGLSARIERLAAAYDEANAGLDQILTRTGS